MHLLEIPQTTLTIVSLCVALCPTLCALMAYQVSRTYSDNRNVNQAGLG
jgi:hypothetical protein